MTTCIDDDGMDTGTTNMPALVPDIEQFYGFWRWWYLPIPRFLRIGNSFENADEVD
jgi:hypothetical protein